MIKQIIFTIVLIVGTGMFFSIKKWWSLLLIPFPLFLIIIVLDWSGVLAP